MAINLAIKYAKQIATRFTHKSYLGGKVSSDYDFTGVKGIRISTPTTVELSNYDRAAASNRYGTPAEMQDTMQELLMSQDKSFSLVIDKGNNTEQMLIKNAGKMLALQIDEKVVPTADKYAFAQFIAKAGTVGGLTAKPTKADIAEKISDGLQVLDDNQIPDEGRYIAMTAEMFKLLKHSPEFLGLEQLGSKSIGKGYIGEYGGVPVVKVPTSYLPADCYFMIWHRSAVMHPYKINEAKVHQDPPGISGALLEGRNLYDAFVLGAKCMAIYAAVLAATKVATPTATYATGDCTLASTTGGAAIKYTIDGSDPRYSSTVATYSAPFAAAAGVVVRAYATKAAMFTSSLLESVATA